MIARFRPYTLNFKRASGTSRGVLHTKDTYLIEIENNGQFGYGECALFKGLSADDVPEYETTLQWTCDNIKETPKLLLEQLLRFPSIQFGLETALKSLAQENPFILYPSSFTSSSDAIPINGLVWMGDSNFMRSQIKEKIDQGFSCVKMKIGAIDFNQELKLLAEIRNEFSSNDMELRVDANGAFGPDEALEKLKRLSEFDIHSIEQPVKPYQWEVMSELCERSPLAIALDEELIGVFEPDEKERLLTAINPQYIILKPALVGGFHGSEDWISRAEDKGIKWWVTSALESNLGLNAIAQWTYSLKTKVTQGLGTGGLFTNNFESPLLVKNGNLHYQSHMDWEFKF